MSRKFVYQTNPNESIRYSVEESLSLLTQSQLHQTDVMIKLLAAIVDLKNAIQNLPQEKVVVKEILKETLYSTPEELKEKPQNNIKLNDWLDDKALEIKSILNATKHIHAQNNETKIIKQKSK